MSRTFSARDTLRTALGLVPLFTLARGEDATHLGVQLPLDYSVLMARFLLKTHMLLHPAAECIKPGALRSNAQTPVCSSRNTQHASRGILPRSCRQHAFGRERRRSDAPDRQASSVRERVLPFSTPLNRRQCTCGASSSSHTCASAFSNHKRRRRVRSDVPGPRPSGSPAARRFRRRELGDVPGPRLSGSPAARRLLCRVRSDVPGPRPSGSPAARRLRRRVRSDVPGPRPSGTPAARRLRRWFPAAAPEGRLAGPPAAGRLRHLAPPDAPGPCPAGLSLSSLCGGVCGDIGGAAVWTTRCWLSVRSADVRPVRDTVPPRVSGRSTVASQVPNRRWQRCRVIKCLHARRKENEASHSEVVQADLVHTAPTEPAQRL